MKKLIFLFPFIAIVFTVAIFFFIQNRNLNTFYPQSSKELTLDKLFSTLNSSDSSTDPFLLDLNGRKLNLSSIRDKVVVLNFWASWCSPCIKEIPSLISLAKKFDNKLIVIAISSDSSETELRSFLKSFQDFGIGNTYVIHNTVSQSIVDEYSINKLPESFIYSQLKFNKKISGAIEWDSDEVLNYLRQIVE